jgi:hypothetical protein
MGGVDENHSALYRQRAKIMLVQDSEDSMV